MSSCIKLPVYKYFSKHPFRVEHLSTHMSARGYDEYYPGGSPYRIGKILFQGEKDFIIYRSIFIRFINHVPVWFIAAVVIASKVICLKRVSCKTA